MKLYTTSRRDFIKSTSAGVIGIGMASAPELYSAQQKSKVAVIRNEKAITDRNVCDKKQVALMIEKALSAVTGKTRPEEIWSSLGITKDDVVGIKVNCNRAGYSLFAHTDLVYALCDNLSSVVRPNNIIIYERHTSELSNAGFKANDGDTGYRCFGTTDGAGYHPKEGLTRIVTDMCTKLINVPTLKAFGGDFVGSLCLKNHIGSLMTSDMPRCHGNTRFITEVCARPSIRDKTVLAMCDGLRGNYKRGVPWFWHGIIMSRDPVAVEYTALQTINEKLKAENEQPNALPSYVKLAETEYKLGTCDPAKILIENTVM